MRPSFLQDKWCLAVTVFAVLYILYIILYTGLEYRTTSYGTDIHHIKSVWERLR